MVVDVLNKMTYKSKSKGHVKCMKVGKHSAEMSHLQSTSDTILFLHHDNQYISWVLILIQVFEAISSPRINLRKSELTRINVEEAMIDDLGIEFFFFLR